MSYDILFVPHRILGTADPMDQLAAAADAHPHAQLTDEQRQEWARITAALAPVLPNADVTDTAEECQLSDATHGIRLVRLPAELALSIPAWHAFDTGLSGGADRDVFEVLQTVAAAVESVTGLVAYDLQTRAPFVGGASGRREVREPGDGERLDAYVGGHESGYLADAPTAADVAPERARGWRRLLRRR